MDETILMIEAMSETELLKRHLEYINKCMEYDLWKDISHTEEYKMRELLGQELRTRMNAQ